MTTEFNRFINISSNTFRLDGQGKHNLLFQLSNHYSYPSAEMGKLTFKNNKIEIPTDGDRSISFSNKYDYPVNFILNRIKTK